MCPCIVNGMLIVNVQLGLGVSQSCPVNFHPKHVCVCMCVCVYMQYFFVAEKMIFQLGMAEVVKVDNTDFASEEEFVHVDFFLQSKLDD